MAIEKTSRRKRNEMSLAEAIQQVIPLIGESSRLYIPSRSRKGHPWLVDVDEYSGTGQCRCEDFMCNHEPYLSGTKAAEGYSPTRRCWHIQVAIEYRHLMDVRSRTGGVK